MAYQLASYCCDQTLWQRQQIEGQVYLGSKDRDHYNGEGQHQTGTATGAVSWEFTS